MIIARHHATQPYASPHNATQRVIHPMPRLRTYLYWIRECSEFGEGWVANEVQATSYDDAFYHANLRVAGRSNAWTLQVEKEPLP